MTDPILVSLVVLALSIVIIGEKVRADIAMLLATAIFLVTGVLTPDAALRGLSSPVTIVVGSMFVFSATVVRAGAVSLAGRVFRMVGRGRMLPSMMAMMIIAALLSAVINNTAVVAIFIPIVISMAGSTGTTRRQLLMPMSFASILGGTCTMIGTSTNILVNSIYLDSGGPGFSMFEITPVAVILAGVGLVYLLTVGRYLLSEEAVEDEKVEKYVTEVILQQESKSVGCHLQSSPIYQDFGDEIRSVERQGMPLLPYHHDPVLAEGDRILLSGAIEKIVQLKDRLGVVILGDDESKKNIVFSHKMFEVIIPSGSSWIGQRLGEMRELALEGFLPVAVRHKGRPISHKLELRTLAAGDVLVVASRERFLRDLEQKGALRITSQSTIDKVDTAKLVKITGILAFMVGSVTLGWLSMPSAAFLAALLSVILGLIGPRDAYGAIDLEVIFLLVGAVAVGSAIQESGLAKIIADQTLFWGGQAQLIYLVAGLYLVTSVLTEIMSNAATVAIITPIALQLASSANVSEKALLIVVMLAGSASFMTPIGYQTNTLIYAPGRYRFRDFAKVGTPLNLLFWILATILIPYFYSR